MATIRRDVRLAGEQIRDYRHICVLVGGPEEADRLLMPFIVEGFEQGIAPSTSSIPPCGMPTSNACRRAGSASKTPSLRASSRWRPGPTLHAWRHLRRLRAARVYRHALDEGRELGFPRTRLIGSTEWSLDEETARDLLEYEKRIDVYLRTVEDIAVCTYDLDHHSARTIAEAMPPIPWPCGRRAPDEPRARAEPRPVSVS